MQGGKEVGRVPPIINGKVAKFFFKEEDMISAFDLNNLYAKSKEKKPTAPTPTVEEKKKN